MALAPITSIPTQLITDGTIVSGDLNASDAANFRTVLDITSGSPAFKNLIIGGDFTTNPWQRGTSFASPANGAYTADRFRHYQNNPTYSTSVYTVSKVVDAPTTAQAGVYSAHSLKYLCTTAQASLSTLEIVAIRHRIEGLNTAQLGWGVAGAKSVTLSFWVKGSTTGTYSVVFANANTDRYYAATYTINAANTWEKKTITIAGDTTGTWAIDNTLGIEVLWGLGSGSSYTTSTVGAWTAGGVITAATGQVNLAAAVNNYIQFALVQLEAGTSATSFEALPADVVLQRCLRYYWSMNSSSWSAFAGYYQNSSQFNFAVQCPVLMRATPSFATTGNGSSRVLVGGTTDSVSAFNQNDIGPYGGSFYVSTAGGGSVNWGGVLEVRGASTPYISLSAEL